MMKKTAVAVIEWLLAPKINTLVKLTIRLKFITAVDNLFIHPTLNSIGFGGEVKVTVIRQLPALLVPQLVSDWSKRDC
ncbi:hypothetical protein OAK26_01385 [Gammaproteobacteria bacterium]|nr:hypothetical protein [Gammaproteobacteria bacterium]